MISLSGAVGANSTGLTWEGQSSASVM
jgi:hypothetical protein